MGFTLLDRPNPHGQHYYPTRVKPLLAIVNHITAGLEDLDTVNDHSAENTANYAGNTDREVSWHSGSDTDSWVDLLPATYTAWHVLNYNSCTYGHEISKKHTDWRVMSPEWVHKTLRNAAIGPDGRGGLKQIALRYGIPLRKATRAELDREIANYNAGRPWKPVGFIGHTELQPEDRLDPGKVQSVDTFPWDQFFSYMHDAPASEKEDDVTYMVKANDVNRKDVYVVTSTADGIWRRHITEDEMRLRLDCGDELKLVNTAYLDRIQKRSITGEVVWNYQVPAGTTPITYTDAYNVLDQVNQNTTPDVPAS